MNPQKTLNMLEPGQTGIILSVGERRSAVKRRLIDMGLTPGTKVTVVKRAPFGDPVELKLRGYALSVRGEDAERIIMGEAVREENGGSSHNAASRRLDRETLAAMRFAHEHELDEHQKEYDSTAHDARPIRIALAGNPNSGKTTLFNALTGSSQYVGNWPGVTVEKKQGSIKRGDREMLLVDLPGIYSLSPYSMEEIVSRNYILGAKTEDAPDVIINIVDGTNLERNLYLSVQLMELEKPMVIALNFMDEVQEKGIIIDIEMLSRLIGVPIIPITAKNGDNLDELIHIVHTQIHKGFTMEPDDLYDDFTHSIHHKVGLLIHDFAYEADLPAHWSAIKLIEGDEVVEEQLMLPDKLKDKIMDIIREFECAGTLGDRETLIADSRYRFIERVTAQALTDSQRTTESVSDRIDKIATHKIFAVPLFLAMMLTMFLITFGSAGSFLANLVAAGIDWAGTWLADFLESINASKWLISLLVDGVIAGVGGVLTFLPQIALLFLFLSILEDSGYMARAAFIMDRLLRHFGLSGKAFIPMLMGFGCSVPAIMGARTMENEKDRRMTIMLIPFMSCSAKLPIYGLITSAFFGRYAGIVIFGLYIFGLIAAILSGIFFKKVLFKGEPAAFVMELPPYRMPSLRNMALHAYDHVKDFLVRAGTVILIMSIVLWILESFDLSLSLTEDKSASLLAFAGSFITPVFAPLGFGFWQAAVAILTGFIAKEAVVASLSMFYNFDLTARGAVVAAAMAGFSVPAAAAFLTFTLLYVPCLAAVSTIYKEMNSFKWMMRSVAWQLLVAYICAFFVYRITLLIS